MELDHSLLADEKRATRTRDRFDIAKRDLAFKFPSESENQFSLGTIGFTHR
jgi:hypothetical protein